jgi:hypothetical protein
MSPKLPYVGKEMGEKMATILMIAVGPVTTLNRSILRTERDMSGTGGDDFMCGHCGSVILEDFDPSTVRGNPVYQCGICENNNDLPFAASDRRRSSR